MLPHTLQAYHPCGRTPQCRDTPEQHLEGDEVYNSADAHMSHHLCQCFIIIRGPGSHDIQTKSRDVKRCTLTITLIPTGGQGPEEGFFCSFLIWGVPRPVSKHCSVRMFASTSPSIHLQSTSPFHKHAPLLSTTDKISVPCCFG